MFGKLIDKSNAIIVANLASYSKCLPSDLENQSACFQGPLKINGRIVQFYQFLIALLLQFIPQVTDDAQNGSTKQLRERLMQEDADLTPEERSKIRVKLDEIADSGKWWKNY